MKCFPLNLNRKPWSECRVSPYTLMPGLELRTFWSVSQNHKHWARNSPIDNWQTLYFALVACERMYKSNVLSISSLIHRTETTRTNSFFPPSKGVCIMDLPYSSWLTRKVVPHYIQRIYQPYQNTDAADCAWTGKPVSLLHHPAQSTCRLCIVDSAPAAYHCNLCGEKKYI